MIDSIFPMLSLSLLCILTYNTRLSIANTSNQHTYSTTSSPRANEDQRWSQTSPKLNPSEDTRRIGLTKENQHLSGLQAKLQKVRELATGQRNSYEISPSTISSIYNFINGKTDKPQSTPVKATDSKPKPVSLLDDSHLLNQPIALGSEPDVFSKPQHSDEGYMQLGPAFPSESIGPMPSNAALPDNSKLFNRAVLSGDDQIFNSMYMNDLQSHQLLGSPPQIMPRVRPHLYTRQAGHLQEAQQNFYNNPSYYPVAQNSIQPPRSRFSSSLAKPKIKRYPNLPKPARPMNFNIPPLPPPPERKKKRNMLTNEQLVSLIDELKEFNSRQASKIQAVNKILPTSRDVKMPAPTLNQSKRPLHRTVVQDVGESSIQEKTPPSYTQEPPRRQQETIREINDENTTPPRLKTKSPEEAKALNFEEDQPKDDVEDDSKEAKVSPDDMTRLAQFLMTKKGADLKFQLGLEKDAKDDGDEEDDHDVLLESKKKQRKARPKDKLLNRLEELNNQHEMVAQKMGSMIDGLGSHRNSKSKSSARSRNADDDRGRSRRDHSVYLGEHREKEVESEEKIPQPDDVQKSSLSTSQSSKPKPPLKVDDEENLAKMLIKQEIMEDQREQIQDPPTTKKPIKSDKKNGQPTTSPSIRSSDVFAETNLPISRAEEGENNYEYPKSERSDDRDALREELQKTRKKKADTRTRIPMAMDEIIKRALDGELGLSTERLPDGQIVFKDGKKTALASMKVPKKSLNKEVIPVEEPDKGNDQLQSEHVPLQEAPQNHNGTEVLDSVQIASQKPLQDEYPISEKVSDRLNKLSSNLDRYFNDGFLREVEAKTGLNEGDVDSHLPQSSNVNTAETVQKPTKKDELKKPDEDFDVDITIDGKKDADRDDDEEEYKDADKSSKTKDRSASSSNRRKTKPKSKSENGVDVKFSKLNKSNKGDGTSTPGKKSKVVKKANIKIHHHEGTVSNLDPVDSESLETPIGPDGEETENPNVTTKTKVKSARGSNVSSNYGKSKFYEEPEWNAR